MKYRMFFHLIILLSIISLVTTASAGPAPARPWNAITSRVCPILVAILATLTVIAPTFVALMFIYGGVKYVYGSEDPGARKSGKMICIHAIIGGIIVAIADAIVLTVLGSAFAASCS